MDIPSVNTALNEVYLENENVEGLRRSITENLGFDQLALAKKLETHELVDLRRLACLLYRSNSKFAEAIELSKKDGKYHDAMEAARMSGSSEVAEDLLKFFIFQKKDKECFAACLYVCYELLRPDVVLELAWRTGFTEQIMPYMIQVSFVLVWGWDCVWLGCLACVLSSDMICVCDGALLSYKFSFFLFSF